MSEYLGNKILDAIFRDENFDFPNKIYLGVSTTNPVTSMTEPTAPSYARVEIDTNSTNFKAADDMQVSNLTSIRFPEATEDWNTDPFLYYGIFDSATGGNLLFYGEITSASGLIVTESNLLEIKPENLSCGFVNES